MHKYTHTNVKNEQGSGGRVGVGEGVKCPGEKNGREGKMDDRYQKKEKLEGQSLPRLDVPLLVHSHVAYPLPLHYIH